jgi:hypothetical protein
MTYVHVNYVMYLFYGAKTRSYFCFFFAVGFEIKWFSGMLPVDPIYCIPTMYTADLINKRYTSTSTSTSSNFYFYRRYG